MSIELKIKSKSLAEEAKIIRQEEKKLRFKARWLTSHQRNADKHYNDLESIHCHRCTIVRNEARATHLARAFLAGLPYSSVETKVKDIQKRDYLVPKITAMIRSYGKITILGKEVYNWINASVAL